MAKFSGIECLCEAVCWLIIGRYIDRLDSFVLDVLADEMILDIDVLGTSMILTGFFGEFDY